MKVHSQPMRCWLFGPAGGLGGDVGVGGTVVLGVVAGAALAFVVVEAVDGVAAQHQDGGEVADGHERHGDVGQ